MPSEPMMTINIRSAIPGFLTLTQSAVVAGVSPPTVHRWVTSGRLTPHRIGGRQILIAADELDRLLAERDRD